MDASPLLASDLSPELIALWAVLPGLWSPWVAVEDRLAAWESTMGALRLEVWRSSHSGLWFARLEGNGLGDVVAREETLEAGLFAAAVVTTLRRHVANLRQLAALYTENADLLGEILDLAAQHDAARGP